MKNILLTAIGALAILVIYAYNNPKANFEKDTDEGIQFHKGTFQEALALAKKENKLVFLDIYATWCGPCKKLKSKTFSDKKVGEFYNQSFVNVALDGENGEGIALARKYELVGYPTLLFINANGEVVSRTAGYHNPSQFIDLGKSITKK